MTEPANLSELDVQLIKFVAAGIGYRGMADLLHIAEGTVRNHLWDLRKTLGAKNNPNLVAIAFHRGILRGKS